MAIIKTGRVIAATSVGKVGSALLVALGFIMVIFAFGGVKKTTLLHIAGNVAYADAPPTGASNPGFGDCDSSCAADSDDGCS